MLAPLGTFGNPLANELDLGRFQAGTMLRRRHQFIGILRANAVEQLAVYRFAGHEGRLAGFQFAMKRFFFSQIQSTFLFIWSMAGRAVLGKNGLDIAREIDLFRL